MSWQLDKNRPICPQICEQICVKIAKGEFKPDERLMSVREVALNAGVNPNTVQKAFEQLESKGLIYSIRGSGWFVSDNTSNAEQTLEKLIKAKTEAYFAEMRLLGFNNLETKNYIKEWDK